MNGNESHTLEEDGILSDGVSYYPADEQRMRTCQEAGKTLLQFQTPVLVHANNPHERLYVACFDGTGNDATKNTEHATNVAGIYVRPERAKAVFFHKPFSRYILPWALAPIFLMTGCHAMNNPPPTVTDRIEPPALTKEVPLRFKRHNFGVACFNVTGCTVIYDGRYQKENAPDKVSPPPPPSPDYAQEWMGGVLGIRNFPPPAEVRWKSLDGVAHEAKVDIGAIFKDELIWHKVPKADMADFYSGPVAGAPDIFLEVNDRTINVYIGMTVPTLTEQIPGNKYSYGRHDNLLAWTHTY